MSECFQLIDELCAELEDLEEEFGCIIYIALGGDLAMLSNVYGQGGQFAASGHRCVFCYVHSTKMSTLDPKDCRRRTPEETCNLAHRPFKPAGGERKFPFTCPACQRVFRDMDVRCCFFVGSRCI